MKEEQHFKEKQDIRNDKELVDEVTKMYTYMAYLEFNNKVPTARFMELYGDLVFEIKRKAKYN